MRSVTAYRRRRSPAWVSHWGTDFAHGNWCMLAMQAECSFTAATALPLGWRA